MRVGLPRPQTAVAWLLLANGVVFVLQILGRGRLEPWLAVVADDWWQVWRYLTFQFLHAGMGHLFFNMLALYFLGMILERAWGTRRFLQFYLVCGACAGLAHVLLSQVFGVDKFVPLIGASGGVYAVLIACAVFFPHIRLLLFFIIPMSIRLVAILLLGVAVFNVLMGIRSAMEGGALSGGISHVAHLGGAVAAGVWVFLGPRLRQGWMRRRRQAGKGAWDRRLREQVQDQQRIDEILDKIRREGIGSLTSKEKRILRDATKRQRKQERDLYRL
jgi:membrane associated rhomboid family serine protease